MAFGSAVAVADLNGDGARDLVVGADGGWSARTFGGDVAGGAWVLRQGTGGRTTGTFAAPGVSSPGTAVGGHRAAGAVHRFPASAPGILSADQVITQEGSLVSGHAEAGDAFGEVLAGGSDDAFVGIPHEDVGSARDAGMVQQLRISHTTDALVAGTSVAQGGVARVGLKVPGKAEAGDEFGAAVGEDGRLIGAPGEDVGTKKVAGAVQRARTSAAAAPRARTPGW